VSNRDNHAIPPNNGIGIKLALYLFVRGTVKMASQLLARVVIKKHDFATMVVMNLATIGQQAFNNRLINSALLQSSPGMS
jgi:hypothetical protein